MVDYLYKVLNDTEVLIGQTGSPLGIPQSNVVVIGDFFQQSKFTCAADLTLDQEVQALNHGWGNCVIFLGKAIFYSPSASLHPGVKMGTGELSLKPGKMLGDPWWLVSWHQGML